MTRPGDGPYAPEARLRGTLVHALLDADDLVELETGAEEVPSLHGAAGDLDQGPAFGDEAQSSRHIPLKS